MGTSHSIASDYREGGAFDDEEFECLVAKYKEISSAGSVAAAQTQLQKLLALPVSDELPQPWRDGLLNLGAAFYELCLNSRELHGSKDTDPNMKLADFKRGAAMCIYGLSQSANIALFRMFLKDKKGVYMDEAELEQLIAACLIMADERVVSSEPKQLVHATKMLVEAALRRADLLHGRPTEQTHSTRQLSMGDFLRWSDAQAPLLGSVFSSWLTRRFFGSMQRPTESAPVLSLTSDILSQSQFIALSLTERPLQMLLHKRVDRLYTNTQDGLSFNRLRHHILGYGGPTLVVIRSTDGDVFGMYCDTEWRESTTFYGRNACFFFRVEPQFSVYRISGNEKHNYMYLNTKDDALPRGIGMGCDVNGFQLFLNEDFDNCYATPKSLSFEPGRLTRHNQFSVEALEVFGCGGDESVQRQREYRKATDGTDIADDEQ